jgi:hypothetical protein
MDTDLHTADQAGIRAVDDEPSARFATSDFLGTHGFEMTIIVTAQMAQTVFRPRAGVSGFGAKCSELE